MPDPTSVCDLGSGIGLVSLALSKAHPHLRLTLQDLPHVVEQSKAVSNIHIYLFTLLDYRWLLMFVITGMAAAEPDSFSESCAVRLFQRRSYPRSRCVLRAYMPQPPYFLVLRDLPLSQLRQVLHDWPDDHCVTILKNIASSMSPKSRLFIRSLF